MCCLFGLYQYGGGKIEHLSRLTGFLAENALERGRDAAGIAYNDGGKLIIHKEPKPADEICFKHPDHAVCVTGHTRHATQGDKKNNYNNHPFPGTCGKIKFALAHNGVITNDAELKKKYGLPGTKIATDSYAAVQLLEKNGKLSVESVKCMAESLRGSYAFSILDSTDTLWLVRGDSPLAFVHFPKYRLYVYASTETILYKSLVGNKLFDEVKAGSFEEIPINTGDILRLKPNGTILKDTFTYTDCIGAFHGLYWWETPEYGSYGSSRLEGSEQDFVEELRSAAVYMGYPADTVDMLLDEGFLPDEIEEYIYFESRYRPN